ncbi:MAG: formate dehydrogenase subunit delta [Blastomonas sp.]
MNSIEKLVYMANQIARNFAVQGDDDAVRATADHIASFWDPRMRAMIIAHRAAGGDGLGDIAAAAIDALPRPESRKAG